jgi:hypothetical protein
MEGAHTMGMTDEQPTHELATPGGGGLYRVVIDGTGSRTGSVASAPMANGVAAGEVRVSVLAETVWARRGELRG